MRAVLLLCAIATSFAASYGETYYNYPGYRADPHFPGYRADPHFPSDRADTLLPTDKSDYYSHSRTDLLPTDKSHHYSYTRTDPLFPSYRADPHFPAYRADPLFPSERADPHFPGYRADPHFPEYYTRADYHHYRSNPHHYERSYPHPQSHYRTDLTQGYQMNDADLANVMQLVQSITNAVHRESLRSGTPVEVKLHPSDDHEHVGVEIKGHLADELASVPADPEHLRQGGAPTLALAGVNDIILPGTGPSIQLSLEGPLADKIRNMPLSQLSLPGNMKNEILSGSYQQKMRGGKGRRRK